MPIYGTIRFRRSFHVVLGSRCRYLPSFPGGSSMYVAARPSLRTKSICLGDSGRSSAAHRTNKTIHTYDAYNTHRTHVYNMYNTRINIFRRETDPRRACPSFDSFRWFTRCRPAAGPETIRPGADVGRARHVRVVFGPADFSFLCRRTYWMWFFFFWPVPNVLATRPTVRPARPPAPALRRKTCAGPVSARAPRVSARTLSGRRGGPATRRDVPVVSRGRFGRRTSDGPSGGARVPCRWEENDKESVPSGRQTRARDTGRRNILPARTHENTYAVPSATKTNIDVRNDYGTK